jgi:alkanesulfonate monooxygenase SsuD/methylene tetrahydromethanopterin reductase-like flavin-dependent oxidoreductase (luciferase family)
MTIKFGLALDFWSNKKPLSQHLDDYVELLKIAEGYGFDSVWAGENRPRKLEPGHTPSPLLILAALAGRTSLRLGTGVTLLTLWQPLRLAYDGALLDQLSDGRLTLGVGVGIAPVMKRYGIPPEEAASRMDDTLKMLKALWSGATEYAGEHFAQKGAVIPGPVQAGGPPLWLGGTIKRSVERAVELGDGWYGATQYHFEVIKRQAGRYRSALQAAGHDPAHGTVSVNRTTFLAPTDAEARREGKAYVSEVLNFYAAFGAITDAAGRSLDPATDLFEAVGDEVYFVGSPASCVQSMQRYVEAGVTQFNFRVSMGDMPAELVARNIRLLGEEVLPRFR